MNRNFSQLVQSTRPASRRLHRRLAHSASLPCVTEAKTFGAAPVAIANLPRALVKEAGMFELLAAEMRIAELEKALAEAQEAACTDPLTGALNRRGFDNASQRELARARRNGVRYALVHIDLDNFKRLNDTYGHQAGDKALKHLVNVMHKSMRPTDVLCRFGGEEFVMMLPETSLQAASTVISRFLRDFSAQAIPETNCVMTFSAGVVAPGLEESLEKAIQRADAATYAAKHAGKNCVVSG